MKLRKLALAALVAAFATPAAAQTYSFEFGSFLTGQGPVTSDTWATMNISNGGSGTTYTFTLSLLGNFDDTFGNQSFVGDAQFNTDGLQGTIGDPILAPGGGVTSMTAISPSGTGGIS